jgi:hypothetical protein
MKALVIGRGETACMLPGFDLYIGVNDCQYNVAHLIVIDPPFVFEHARRSQIVKHPAKLFTNLAVWGELRHIEPIQLAPRRNSIETLAGKVQYPYTNNSPYVAVCHAFFQGAKEIVMCGVDMTTHKSLSHPNKVDSIRLHYSILHKALSKHGCKLYLYKNHGVLSGYIPALNGA